MVKLNLKVWPPGTSVGSVVTVRFCRSARGAECICSTAEDEGVWRRRRRSSQTDDSSFYPHEIFTRCSSRHTFSYELVSCRSLILCRMIPKKTTLLGSLKLKEKGNGAMTMGPLGLLEDKSRSQLTSGLCRFVLPHQALPRSPEGRTISLLLIPPSLRLLHPLLPGLCFPPSEEAHFHK